MSKAGIIKKYFQHNSFDVKGHIKGIISVDDTDKTSIPNDSVIDSVNMDFYEGYDKRRDPYSIHTDLSSLLPENYKIIKSEEIYLTDGAGNGKSIFVVSAKNPSDSNSKLRIFLKGYYSPDTTYQNNYKNSGFGWNDDWIEITEHYKGGESGITFEPGYWYKPGVTSNYFALRSSNTEFNKGDNFFRGFFVFNSDGELIGNVTDSLWTNFMPAFGTYQYSRYPTHDNWAGNPSGSWYNGPDQEVNYVIKCTDITDLGDGTWRIKFDWSSDGSNWTNIIDEVVTDGVMIDITVNNFDNGVGVRITGLGAYPDQFELEETVTIPVIDVSDGYKGYFAVQREIDSSTGVVYSLSSTAGICRFPVNQFNSDVWKNVTNVNYRKFQNGISIYCGSSSVTSRNLWLGFLSEKKYFGGFSIGALTYNTGNNTWASVTGTYTGDVDINIKVKCTVLQAIGPLGTVPWHVVFVYSMDGGTTWKNLIDMYVYSSLGYFEKYQYLEKGITIRIIRDGDNALAAGDIVTIPITKNTYYPSWNGFWFGYESFEPDNIDKFIVSKSNATSPPSGGSDDDNWVLNNDYKELGLMIAAHGHSLQTQDGTNGYLFKDESWGVAAQLDSHQAFFIEKFIGLRSVISTTPYLRIIDIHLLFRTSFDRRLSGLYLFYDRENYSQGIMGFEEANSFKSQKPVYLLPQRWNGTSNMSDGFQRFTIQLPNMPLASVDPALYYKTLTPYNVNRAGNDEFSQNSGTDGVSEGREPIELNAFLNNYFYRGTSTKCKGAVQVGVDAVAYGFSPDTVNKDETLITNPAKMSTRVIGLGQVQQGNVYCNNIFVIERMLPVTNEDIVSVVSTSGNRFLVLTANICKWYEIADSKNRIINVKGEYLNKGAISEGGIVRAVFEDKAKAGTAADAFGAVQFSGVFYNNYDSVWGFFDNEPVDLLYGRWKIAYKKLSEATRLSCSSGFYPNRMEVWFRFGSDIWIFNLRYNHWKKYSYPDTFKYSFVKGDGELYFNDDYKMYATEPEGTAKYLDKEGQAGEASISFSMVKYINHGNTAKSKVPHGIDLLYEMDTKLVLGEPTEGGVRLKVTSNLTKSNNGWIVKTDGNPKSIILRSGSKTDNKHREIFTWSTRANYYRVEILSDTANAGNITKFRILQLTHNAELTRNF